MSLLRAQVLLQRLGQESKPLWATQQAQRLARQWQPVWSRLQV
jgi:hypothetical protein